MVSPLIGSYVCIKYVYKNTVIKDKMHIMVSRNVIDDYNS